MGRGGIDEGRLEMRDIREAWIGVLLALVTTALLAGGCSTGSSASGPVTEVDAAGFLEASARSGAVVVDVRSPEEYAQGHLPGAVNISVEAADFAERIAQLDPTATTLVYCRSGRRSTIAADLMAQAGFTDIVNFSSGGAADLQTAGAVLTTS